MNNRRVRLSDTDPHLHGKTLNKPAFLRPSVVIYAGALYMMRTRTDQQVCGGGEASNPVTLSETQSRLSPSSKDTKSCSWSGSSAENSMPILNNGDDPASPACGLTPHTRPES